MKKYNIFIVFTLVVTLVGCNKDNNTTTEEWGDVNIPLDPSKHYIHFDADVNTRGALVEGNLLLDDFMVLGYQYPGTWESEAVLAMPNVFDETPERVYYRTDGTYDYLDKPDEKFKVWAGNKYSFFAYYPSDHGAITLFDNGTAKQGDPYIIYKLPISSDPRDLIDVMTASYIDTGVASSASVGLEFHHRLCAIDVGARNYYEYNHDQDPATPHKDVTIEIVNLEVNLTNVTSTSAKIYLDHTIPTELNYISPKASISYKMVDKDSEWAVSSYDVEPNTASDRAIRLVTTPSGENASSLLLLPQEDLLQGALKLTYKKKYQEDDGTWTYLKNDKGGEEFVVNSGDSPDPNNPSLPIKFTKQLIEGRRYYIELTFTSDAVSVNIIAADEWEDKEDINHEFE